MEAVIDATIISAQAERDYPPWIHAPAKTKAVGEFLASPLYSLTGSLDAEEGCPFSLSLHLVLPDPIDAALHASVVGLDPFRKNPRCKIRRSR